MKNVYNAITLNIFNVFNAFNAFNAFIIIFTSCPMSCLCQESVLVYLNKIRANHSANPVTWSPNLAVQAQLWADTLTSKNQFQHSNLGYGENIAITYNTGTFEKSLIAAIDMWYSEESIYDWKALPVPQLPQGALHFTQLVWASTTSIGAAISISKSFPKQVCVVMEFDPPGNYIGRFGVNVFPPQYLPTKMPSPPLKIVPGTPFSPPMPPMPPLPPKPFPKISKPPMPPMPPMPPKPPMPPPPKPPKPPKPPPPKPPKPTTKTLMPNSHANLWTPCLFIIIFMTLI